MSKFIVRILIVFLVWLVFTFVSTSYYMLNVHDVGGTYWAMGFFSFPIVAVFIWCADFYLQRISALERRNSIITAIDSVLAIVLYYPGLVIILRGIHILGNA